MAAESMWSSEAWTSAADTYLLARAREGSDEAFAELWRRHLPTAHAVASRHTSRVPAEDIVAEAATRVLSLIRDDRGPKENFRAYFLTAVRSVALDAGRHEQKVIPVVDEDLDNLLEPVLDEERLSYDPELVRAAFSELGERDQRVLWHTTVEGEAPRVVGPTLGMTANAVSVRAMRAREALRVSYLEAYAAQRLPGAATPECAWAIGVLGTHLRGRLARRAHERLDEHLDGCEHEKALLVELKSIQARFPALVVPLVFLAGAGAPGLLGGAGLTGLGATAGGVELEGGAEVEAVDGVTSSAAQTPPDGPAGSGRPDLVGALSGVTAVAALALIAAGLTGSSGVAPADVARPVASSGTAGPGTSSPGTATTVPLLTGTPAVGPSPTTPASTTTTAPTPPPPAAPVTAAPAPPPDPAEAAPDGPGIDLRLVSSGKGTKFSLRFSPAAPGDVTVTVANAYGTGRLVIENDAYVCTSTSASSVACTGRTGHILLSQTGAQAPQPVVVRVADSAGATTTRTLTLR